MLLENSAVNQNWQIVFLQIRERQVLVRRLRIEFLKWQRAELGGNFDSEKSGHVSLGRSRHERNFPNVAQHQVGLDFGHLLLHTA